MSCNPLLKNVTIVEGDHKMQMDTQRWILKILNL